jgi:hypothetical protein
MKNSPNIKTSSKNRIQSNDYNWRVYELLIAELKHQHNVWMDNFRVILTFNSILLPGSFATFALILQGKVGVNGLALQFLPLPIVALSTIGIFTTLVMMIIISRIRALTVLRQDELRKVEMQMIQDLPVYPFLEGYVLSGGKITDSENPVNSNVKPMKWYWFRGQLGYNLIGFGFVIAYIFLGVASIILWK